MRARVLTLGRRWIALSASRGWPWRLRRAWLARNEYDLGTWHAGFILLGVSAEVRWGSC